MTEEVEIVNATVCGFVEETRDAYLSKLH